MCDVTICCVYVVVYAPHVAVACVLVFPDSNVRPTRHAAGLVTSTSPCLVVTRVCFILVFF